MEKILAAIPEFARTAAAAPGNYDSLTQVHNDHGHAAKVGGRECTHRWQDRAVARMREGRGDDPSEHGDDVGLPGYGCRGIAAKALRAALAEVAQRTFNSITVDGDTSTNDTALLLASGASRNWGAPAVTASGRGYKAFVAALEKVCRKLALAIVSDGEGASRVVEIEIVGAPR